MVVVTAVITTNSVARGLIPPVNELSNCAVTVVFVSIITPGTLTKVRQGVWVRGGGIMTPHHQ